MLWRNWLGELGQDWRFALRQVRGAPGFAATAIIVAALGIGANTAMFSVVHHLILEPLPFADGNRMVQLRTTANAGFFAVSPTQSVVDAWRGGARTVDHVLEYSSDRAILGDTSVDEPERAWALATVPGELAFVGARVETGRDLVADDTLATAPPVVVISDGIWRRRFGGAASAIGATLALDGVPHTVIGVLPKDLQMPFVDADVVRALRHTGGERKISALAKLRSGYGASDANRELAVLFAPTTRGARVQDSTVRAVDNSTVADVPTVTAAADLIGSDERAVVLALFGAVGFVLLIACANVANLLMARAWGRQREFAVRVALGAGRGRLVRQVFTESMTLSLAGGLLGVGIAFVTLRWMIADRPMNADLASVRIEPVVLLWTLGVAMLTGIVFGIVPAVFAASNQISEALKSGARTASGSRAARRVRSGLLVVEVAFSVALLAGAGVLVRSLIAMTRFDVGFEPRGLAAMTISLRGPRYGDLAARQATFSAIVDRLRQSPGIAGVALADQMPPNHSIFTGSVQIESRALSDADSLKLIGFQSVTPNFFAVAGIPIRQGRVFSPSGALSDRSGGDEVMISESFARRFWPDRGAIGARIRLGQMPWATIVGVVPDVRLPGGSLRDRELQVYEARPSAMPNATVILRSQLSLAALATLVRGATRDADAALKLRRAPISAESVVSNSRATHRFVLTLLGIFAALALVLAAIGVYGVIAYNVSQRTREIGIRMALGAQPPDVVRLVVGEGLGLALGGTVAGTALALGTTRALGGLLWGVAPGDPLTLVLVAATLALVATTASLVPARRAAAIDPLEALRAD